MVHDRVIVLNLLSFLRTNYNILLIVIVRLICNLSVFLWQ